MKKQVEKGSHKAKWFCHYANLTAEGRANAEEDFYKHNGNVNV